MISLDQVLLLEQKVESAVAKIAQLQAENDALRSRCSELTNALSSKSEQLSSFESDQNKIENGILKALDRLNSIENSVLKAAGQVSLAGNARQAAPVSPVSQQNAAAQQVTSNQSAAPQRIVVNQNAVPQQTNPVNNIPNPVRNTVVTQNTVPQQSVVQQAPIINASEMQSQASNTQPGFFDLDQTANQPESVPQTEAPADNSQFDIF